MIVAVNAVSNCMSLLCYTTDRGLSVLLTVNNAGV